MPERPSPWVAALPALALFAVWRVLALATPRPTEAAEARYLALPLALVTLAAVTIPRRRAPALLCVLGLAALALLPGAGGARAVLAGVLCSVTLLAALLEGRTDGLQLPGWVALAIALQALFRPGLFLSLEPSWALLLSLVALPTAVAWAADRLAATRGVEVAAIAAGSALVLEGWLGPATCASLLTAVLLESVPPWRRRRLARPFAIAIVGAAALLAVSGNATDWRSALLLPALLAVVLPGAPLISWWRFLISVALAVGLARAFGTEGWVLVPPSLLVTLGPIGGHRARRTQLGWTAILVATGAVWAFYPWNRLGPVPWIEAVAPEMPAWGAALTVVGLSIVLVRRRHPWRLLAAFLTAIALFAAPHADTLLDEPVVLDGRQSSWTHDLPAARAISQLTIQSYLTGAGSLPAGSEVGEVELLMANGTARRRALLLGRDTADRDGTATAREPWSAQVDPTGGRFVRSARSVWPLGDPHEVAAITVRLRGGRPAGARLVLLWVGGEP